MHTLQFIARFREMHDLAKKGTLPAAARPEYERARTELGRLLNIAQQMSRGGNTLRSSLRIAQLVKVEIFLSDPPMKSTTIDLASGGFAALLGLAIPVGRSLKFRLYLPALSGTGVTPIEGMATVASARSERTLFRVSFRFSELAADAREHLEMTIIDSVLTRFNEPK